MAINAKILQEIIGLEKKVSEIFQNAHQNEEAISKTWKKKRIGVAGQEGRGWWDWHYPIPF